MDEVDAGVGLEQVAPGALAGMRLARDQQHAQLVAHAVDRDHRAVVDGVSSPSSGEASISTMFGPACGIGTLTLTFAPDADVALSIISPSRRTVTCAGVAGGALVLDAEGDGLRLADDAEARRGRPARRGGRARRCGR